MSSNADDTTNVAEYDFTVDKLGRVTSVLEEIGGLTTKITVSLDYDAVGNRTIMSTKLSTEEYDELDYKSTYTYDALNRLDNVQQTSQSGGHAVANKRVNYVYNALSQVTYINRFENLTATEPALRTVMTYDGASRLATIQHRDVDSVSTSTLINQYSYSYDYASRITQIDSTLDGVSNYTFDTSGQVSAADHATGRTDESYTYDETGNRTGGDYSVTAKNRTSASAGFTYEYDKEGNRTKRTKTSDSSYEVYTFDHRNRLTKVAFYNSSNALTKSIDYTYDMFNRMVRRTLDSNGSGSGGVRNIWWAGFDGTSAHSQRLQRSIFS